MHQNWKYQQNLKQSRKTYPQISFKLSMYYQNELGNCRRFGLPRRIFLCRTASDQYASPGRHTGI